jgi:hypothetical protein
MLASTPAHVRSLAVAAPGELVKVEIILFDALRARCAELGITAGDTLRCRSITHSLMTFETARGRTVALEREWARFIQIDWVQPVSA